MGSLAQISSGAIRRSFNTRFRARFRRVQIPVEVPEGSGADTWWGSGGFRFWRVPVQIPVEVLEGFGAASRWGSGGFRCRYRVEVPVGSGADSRWGFGGFRCRYSVRFRKVRVQMLCEVPEGSDVFNGINFYFFLGRSAERQYMMHSYTCRFNYFAGGGQGMAKKKFMHKWLYRPSALQTETKFWRNETAT